MPFDPISLFFNCPFVRAMDGSSPPINIMAILSVYSLNN